MGKMGTTAVGRGQETEDEGSWLDNGSDEFWLVGSVEVGEGKVAIYVLGEEFDGGETLGVEGEEDRIELERGKLAFGKCTSREGGRVLIRSFVGGGI